MPSVFTYQVTDTILDVLFEVWSMFLADFYIMVIYNDVLAKISYTKYY